MNLTVVLSHPQKIKITDYKEVQSGSLPVIKWDDIAEEVDVETHTLEVVVEAKIEKIIYYFFLNKKNYFYSLSV